MVTRFQHGKDESPGEIGIYLRELGISFTTVRLYEHGNVPRALPSALIILGGRMSVNDTKEYPFLLDEQRVIREMVAAGRPVLGICLGAQLIAAAFGEQVFLGTRERGWVSVYPCGGTENTIFPEPLTVFHWHNETFTLPACTTAPPRSGHKKPGLPARQRSRGSVPPGSDRGYHFILGRRT